MLQDWKRDVLMKKIMIKYLNVKWTVSRCRHRVAEDASGSGSSDSVSDASEFPRVRLPVVESVPHGQREEDNGEDAEHCQWCSVLYLHHNDKYTTSLVVWGQGRDVP